ncbi:MAG: hypothetical protein QOI37_180 [Chloroflexota bacterium]|jgi:hypothetical protein|nr:hypothetical protein [Chloroflexota bacterium]MEA2652953.1 hypothetical protein [Chloroflexota bacterium]
MDHRDRPFLLPDGATCTACGAAVPSGRIRTLARRDDLAFVELDCPACGSSAVGLLLSRPGPDGAPFLDVGEDPSPSSAARGADARPAYGAYARPAITAADVEAVRMDLAAWDGDLVTWLGR